MKNLIKKVGLFSNIEIVANLAIIIVACLLAVVLVKNYLFKPPSGGIGNGQSASQLVNGTRLSSLDVDWKQSRQTLLLAISSTCHFCTDSAPFYKRLVLSKEGTHVVAILPQSIQDGHEYLQRLGVSVDEVRQLDLDRIGVEGTPTLLLVDNSGVVKSSWFGKLQAEQEESVLNALLGKGN